MNICSARNLYFYLILGLLLGFQPSHLHAQTNLSASDVKGGLVSPNKNDNIFDPSSNNKAEENAAAIRSQERAAEQEREAQQQAQKEDSENRQSAENAGTPGPLPISREDIAKKAGGDSALMNALEQSRKLQERLGIVGGKKKSDPKEAIDGIKNSIERQKKLEEKQKYQF